MEKRRFSRTSFVATGSLLVGSVSVDCAVVNISLKGALVELDDASGISRDQPVALSFKLGDEDTVVTAQGKCAHIEGTEVGIRFTSMDLDSLTHLRRLMELNTADAESIEQELGFLVDE
jgi:hypothetical protein